MRLGRKARIILINISDRSVLALMVFIMMLVIFLALGGSSVLIIWYLSSVIAILFLMPFVINIIVFCF